MSSVSASLIAVVFIAISLGSLIKGITGVGLPLVAVPAIAAFTSVEEAVVLMIVPVLGSNLWLVRTHRRFVSLLRAHRPFLVAGFFGGVAGTHLLAVVDDRWLKLVLAAWLALYLAQYAFGNVLWSKFPATTSAAAVAGVTAGAIQGATGVSAHIVAPYFHGRKSVEPLAYAFLVASAFLVFSTAQLAAASGIGLFTSERIGLGLIALLPTLVFTHVGTRLAAKVSHTVFQRLLIALFVVMEIKLIADVSGFRTV